MPPIMQLSYIWEFTISKILNHDTKSELGTLIREWVTHNKLEDFDSPLNFNVDDLTPSGILCYYKDNAGSVILDSQC